MNEKVSELLGKPRGLLNRFSAWLAGVPTWAFILFFLSIGVVLRLPVLQGNFFSDDLFFIGMLEDVYPVKRSPFDLFNFMSGDPRENLLQKSIGTIFWWSNPDLQISFFRPLSSILYWVDYKLFRFNAILWHVHSLLWWVGVVYLSTLLLLRFLPRNIALGALLFFSLDDGSLMHIHWLAQRYALVAVFFGLLGLLFYVRYRREGWSPGIYLSGISFFLSLLGGEYGILIILFAPMYELFMADETLLKRVKYLAVPAIPLFIYFTIHKILGYGVHGSELYLDPFRETKYFIQALPERFLYLMGMLFFSIQSLNHIVIGVFKTLPLTVLKDLESLGTQHIYPALFSLFLFVIFLPYVYYFIRGLESKTRKVYIWFFLSSMAGLVLVSPSPPHFRHTLAGGIIVAILYSGFFFHLKTVWKEKKYYFLIFPIGFILFHSLYVPDWSHGASAKTRIFNKKMRSVTVYHQKVDVQKQKKSKMILLVAPTDETLARFLPLIRYIRQGIPLPESFWVISMANRRHKLFRKSEKSLELSVTGEGFFSSHFEGLYRTKRLRAKKGEVTHLKGLDIEILDVGKKHPLSIRMTFDRNLEDESLKFGISTAGGLRKIVIPPVGETVILPGAEPVNHPVRIR